jgi:tetratricopeptide (TPR) repeat protein
MRVHGIVSDMLKRARIPLAVMALAVAHPAYADQGSSTTSKGSQDAPAAAATSKPTHQRSHATQAPNPRSHATQAPNPRSHATQAPNPRSHATQAPNPRSHATQAPNPRSHATQAPNPRSHATQAPPAERSQLAKAIEHYQRSEFDQAKTILGSLAKQLGNTKNRQAQQVHTYLALVFIAYSEPEKAMSAFARALAINPQLALESPSPKIARIFEQAKRRYRAKVRALDHDPPRLSHVPPKKALYGKRVRLSANVQDLSAIKDVLVSYRISGHRGFASLKMERTKDGRYLATLPKVSVVRPGVEYYIEAWDVLGNGPGLKGSARRPIRITVQGGPLSRPPKKLGPSPWYKRWWVWAIAAGVVIAAGATVTGVYLGRDRTGRAEIDPIGLP